MLRHVQGFGCSGMRMLRDRDTEGCRCSGMRIQRHWGAKVCVQDLLCNCRASLSCQKNPKKEQLGLQDVSLGLNYFQSWRLHPCPNSCSVATAWEDKNLFGVCVAVSRLPPYNLARDRGVVPKYRAAHVGFPQQKKSSETISEGTANQKML